MERYRYVYVCPLVCVCCVHITREGKSDASSLSVPQEWSSNYVVCIWKNIYVLTCKTKKNSKFNRIKLSLSSKDNMQLPEEKKNLILFLLMSKASKILNPIQIECNSVQNNDIKMFILGI